MCSQIIVVICILWVASQYPITYQMRQPPGSVSRAAATFSKSMRHISAESIPDRSSRCLFDCAGPRYLIRHLRQNMKKIWKNSVPECRIICFRPSPHVSSLLIRLERNHRPLGTPSKMAVSCKGVCNLGWDGHYDSGDTSPFTFNTWLPSCTKTIPA